MSVRDAHTVTRLHPGSCRIIEVAHAPIAHAHGYDVVGFRFIAPLDFGSRCSACSRAHNRRDRFAMPMTKLIAEHASGLFIARALDSPRMKPPGKGKVVDLRDLASLPDPKLDRDKLFEQRPAMWARYLGTVTIR